MLWDVARQRGAGFVLHPLQPAGVYPVLSTLNCANRLRPGRLERLVAAEAAADMPLMGPADLPQGMKRLLRHLVETGLVERSAGSCAGARPSYAISVLGAGMLRSLTPTARWLLEPGTSHFDDAVVAVRQLRELPAIKEPAPERLRHPKLAIGLIVQLLAPRWARPVLMYVDSAGEGGLSPSKLLEQVNGDAEASSGLNRIEWRLRPETAYMVLHHLMSAGLLEKRRVPPRVLYRLTPAGEGLMRALWEVSRWGMAHDAELFAIVARTTGWFPNAPRD